MDRPRPADATMDIQTGPDGIAYVWGDLLAIADAGHVQAIAHGANCMSTMGAGIAAAIAHRWPSVSEADRYCRLSEYQRMGHVSSQRVQAASGPLLVVNAYTQVYPGRPRFGHDRVEARLAAIRQSLTETLDLTLRDETVAEQQRLTVGIPRIGAGLAGLTWASVSQAIAPIATKVNGDRQASLLVVVRPQDLPAGANPWDDI